MMADESTCKLGLIGREQDRLYRLDRRQTHLRRAATRKKAKHHLLKKIHITATPPDRRKLRQTGTNLRPPRPMRGNDIFDGYWNSVFLHKGRLFEANEIEICHVIVYYKLLWGKPVTLSSSGYCVGSARHNITERVDAERTGNHGSANT